MNRPPRQENNAVMQKHIFRIVIALAVATAAHPLEGLVFDAAARAASVLAEARAALGGAEKLQNVKTLQAAGDYRRSMGEMQMEGELEVLIEPPDRMRRNETIIMPNGGTMVRTEVLNGDEIWDDSGQRGGMGGHMAMVLRGPGGRTMNEEEMKDLRRRMRRADLNRYLLAWLLASEAPVTHAGVAEAPDGSADVLEVKPAEGPALRLFVDQKTRRPLMLTWQGPRPRMMMRRGPGGPPNPEQLAREAAGERAPEEATFEMRFDDYREVDGVHLPHHITRGTNGSVNEEWTIRRYTLNASFKSNTFTK